MCAVDIWPIAHTIEHYSGLQRLVKTSTVRRKRRGQRHWKGSKLSRRQTGAVARTARCSGVHHEWERHEEAPTATRCPLSSKQ